MRVLQGARVVLCVAGSIAAYKSADLASKLTQAGSAVDVVLTESAAAFAGPLTFEALTQRAVYTGALAMTSDHRIAHVELAQAADAVVFAPATAASLARLAQGGSDDLATAIALATQAPLVVAPAMEPEMYAHAATQANLMTLRERGVHVVAPAEGRVASGAVGRGRLADTETLLDAVRLVLGRAGTLQGRTVVVSAGGTREFLDPARFIGNPSTGAQGTALARVARDRGAAVRLVIGQSRLQPPYGVETTPVTSAAEMLAALRKAVDGCDALVMNAAVTDYRPASASSAKLKRDGEPRALELVENPDLLDGLRGDYLRIAFAAESHNLMENARRKLAAKDLDAIAVNDITRADRGFAADTNAVTIITRSGDAHDTGLCSKDEIAEAVMDVLEGLLRQE